jgi:hypothetical protein
VSTTRCSILVCVLVLLGQSQSTDSRSPVPVQTSTTSIASKFACVDGPYSKPLPPPGPACEKELFARHGRPFMFPVHGGIVYGVSAAPGKESALYLWVDNQTAESVSLLFCCVTTVFDSIDIFDSEGRRVLSKNDLVEQKARSEGRELVQVCTCSGWRSVPPHTVQLFVSADVYSGYNLEPGRYTIVDRYPASPYSRTTDEHESSPRSRSGLTISLP